MRNEVLSNLTLAEILCNGSRIEKVLQNFSSFGQLFCTSLQRMLMDLIATNLRDQLEGP